jgi:hypothetical protein
VIARWNVAEDNDLVQLTPPGDPQPWSLDPREAWDLGDDLLIIATRIMDRTGDSAPLEVIDPPWLTDVSITRWGAMTLLTCAQCVAAQAPTVDIAVDDMNLAQMVNAAREHWLDVHQEWEANSEESE